MSLYGLSQQQLEQLMYPQGRGQFQIGNAPVFQSVGQNYLNPQPQDQTSGAWPSGTGAAMPAPAAAAPVAAPAAPAGGGGILGGLTGGGGGAGLGGAAGGAGGFASIAGSAINQIAGVASNYLAAKAKADALGNTQAVPNIPESGGAIAGFTPPALSLA